MAREAVRRDLSANRYATAQQPEVESPQPTHARLTGHVVQRARKDPAKLAPVEVMQLQRTMGNAAVAHLLYGSGRRPPQPPSADPVRVQRMHDPIVQRKLNWENTEWSRARYMDASVGGAGGVLFVGEDSPREVVVKAGDPLSLETLLASTLINETTQGGDEPQTDTEPQPKPRRGFGKFFKKKTKQKNAPVRSDLVVAPGMRIIGQNYEMIEMIAALEALKGQIPDEQREKADRLLNRLREPGSIVQEVGKGTDFVDLIREVGNGVREHTKTKRTLFGKKKTKFRKESPYVKLLGDPSRIRSLGRGTAVDIFMGNRDRMLFVFNPENFLWSDDSITFIDNVFGMSDASFFKNTKWTIDRYGKLSEISVTTEESMSTWLRDPKNGKEVRWLIANDYTSIAEEAWGKLRISIGASGDKETNARDQALKPYKQTFMSNFTQGLAIGKAKLLANLDQMTPQKLAALMPGVEEETLTQIMGIIEARRNLLRGEG